MTENEFSKNRFTHQEIRFRHVIEERAGAGTNFRGVKSGKFVDGARERTDLVLKVGQAEYLNEKTKSGSFTEKFQLFDNRNVFLYCKESCWPTPSERKNFLPLANKKFSFLPHHIQMVYNIIYLYPSICMSGRQADFF